MKAITLLSSAALLGTLAVPFQTYAADPVVADYLGPSYAGTTAQRTTADKPQSKLWYTDGAWWGGLFDSSDQRFHIYRLDPGSHAWSSTSAIVDDRNQSHADYLWDESTQTLYAVSTDEGTSSDGLRAYRYSYAASTNTYTLDPEFVDVIDVGKRGVPVAPERAETATIAKDTTGKLWVTYVADGLTADTSVVMLTTSTDGGETWGTPFQLPPQTDPLHDDDISAVITLAENQIGVMWSDQAPDTNGNSGFYFTTHADAAAENQWSTIEVAYAGTNVGNDHMNLKVDGSTLYAVVKTENSNPANRVVSLLKRTSGGSWSNYPVTLRGAGDQTRPEMAIDTENDEIYVFSAETEAGGTIYYKHTPIDAISFDTSSKGAVLIQDAQAANVNDPSGAKQNATKASGIVILASDKVAQRYLHGEVDLSGAVAPYPFTDVPVGATFRDDILWIYQHGITNGCVQPDPDTGTGGKYCPLDDVSREQMAAFLDRSFSADLTNPPGDYDPFTDDNNAYQPNIERLAFNGITNGCVQPDPDTQTGGKYCPKDSVTREQMAAFLDRALGDKLANPPANYDPFTDDNNAFQANIERLAFNGITTGCVRPDPNTGTGGQYCPKQTVTREQMAAFLRRSLELD